MCIPDLVIIKYFGNNTIEIKRLAFTYPDLLPSALVVQLELIIILYCNIIILWDHRRICGPSLIETSLCGAYLYSYTSTEETEEVRLGWKDDIKTDLKNGECDCGLDSYY